MLVKLNLLAHTILKKWCGLQRHLKKASWERFCWLRCNPGLSNGRSCSLSCFSIGGGYQWGPHGLNWPHLLNLHTSSLHTQTLIAKTMCDVQAKYFVVSEFESGWLLFTLWIRLFFFFFNRGVIDFNLFCSKNGGFLQEYQITEMLSNTLHSRAHVCLSISKIQKAIWLIKSLLLTAQHLKFQVTFRF